MGGLDDPSSRLETRVAPDFLCLLVPWTDVRDIAPHGHLIGFPSVSCVKTEVFSCLGILFLLHDLGVEEPADFLAVMHVCPGYDDRQRDAMPVDEDVPLGSIFSPCP